MADKLELEFVEASYTKIAVIDNTDQFRLAVDRVHPLTGIYI
ncbi:MAG: hypothetical protein U5K79_00755 [Cyclobacteriaceae bacterium]|nr:hypothetical protein [Cyclobacteriaceae bacterium]